VPVEVLGFNGTPEAGDRFAVVENEARAREITDYRSARSATRQAGPPDRHARGSLEEMMASSRPRAEGIPAGHQGRRAGLGGSDQSGARPSSAPTRSPRGHAVGRRRHHRIRRHAGGIDRAPRSSASTCAPTRKRAKRPSSDGIEIRYYNIIYNLVDDVKAAMSGLLTPERRETMLGNAAIQEVFNMSKVGKVAGCRVTDGTVERGAERPPDPRQRRGSRRQALDNSSASRKTCGR
jgi:translation initiation factor IF-2